VGGGEAGSSGGFLVHFGFDHTPNELGVLEDEPEFDPESEPMFGQLAESPPRCGAGAGAGVVPDESDPDESDPDEFELGSGCVVDGPLLLEELSVCAYATAAPLPSMIPARANPATACLSRMVMSFTSFLCLGSSMSDEPGISL
jgi:hypothetical protein